jgi:hypothetical protein
MNGGELQLAGWLKRLQGVNPYSRAGCAVIGQAYLAGRISELEEALHHGGAEVIRFAERAAP